MREQKTVYDMLKEILSQFDDEDNAEISIGLDGLKFVVGLKTFDCFTSEIKTELETAPMSSLDDGLLLLLDHLKSLNNIKEVTKYE